MTQIYLYHANSPYLPLVACTLHLDLGLDSSGLMIDGLRRDWDNEPLFVAGMDRRGAVVCSLAHGRRRELYSRTMEGLSELFGINLVRLDLDGAISKLSFADRIRIKLAAWRPAGYGQQHISAVASFIRPLVIKRRGDEG